MKCWPSALAALALQAWLAQANGAVKARKASKDELDGILPDDQETLLAERDDLKAQLATKNQEFLVQHRRAHQLSIKVSALEKKLEAESKKERLLRDKLGKVRALLDDDNDGTGDSIDEDSRAPALPAPAHVHLEQAETDAPVVTKVKGKRAASAQHHHNSKSLPMPTALASSTTHARKDISFVERGSTNPAIMWPKRLGQGRMYPNNPPGEPSGAPLPGEPSGRWRNAQQPQAQAAPTEEVRSKKPTAKHAAHVKAAHSGTARAQSQAHGQHSQRSAPKATITKAPRAEENAEEKAEEKAAEPPTSGSSLSDSVSEEKAEEKVSEPGAASHQSLKIDQSGSGTDFDDMENQLQDEDHRIDELERDSQEDDDAESSSGSGAELGDGAA